MAPMPNPEQKKKAETLRALHAGTGPLLLVNVWDVASARLIEEAGFPAIATSSAGVAFAHGFPDGQKNISRPDACSRCRHSASGEGAGHCRR